MRHPKFPLALTRRPLAVCLSLALTVGGARAASDPNDIWGAGHLATRTRHDDSPAAWIESRLQSLDTTGLLSRHPQGGPTVVVQNCNDSGPGSLRDAYFNAVDGETIDLTQLTCSTITLATGALTDSPSATDVELDGPGPYNLAIDGNQAGRVLVHNGAGYLSLVDLTVRNGNYAGIYGGGCIYSYGGVDLTGAILTSCSMTSSGNAQANGGAVYAHGSVELFVSLVSGSSAHAASAASAGGGIWADRVNVVASTVTGNVVSGDGNHDARGGGVFALSNTTIEYSTISGNQAGAGGGVFSFISATSQPVNILDSTISGNSAVGAAGGVYSKYALNLSNSTVAENRAGFQFGAGLYLVSSAELESSIVANNSSEDGLYASDIGGLSSATLSGANNLIVASTLTVPPDTITADPMLGPLQNNGGFSYTQALLPDSPAINHGNNVEQLSYDQRLFPYERVVGSSADIGAFEFGAPDRIFTDGFDTPPHAPHGP